MNKRQIKDRFWSWLEPDLDRYTKVIDDLLDVMTEDQVREFVSARVCPDISHQLATFLKCFRTMVTLIAAQRALDHMKENDLIDVVYDGKIIDENGNDVEATRAEFKDRFDRKDFDNELDHLVNELGDDFPIELFLARMS